MGNKVVKDFEFSPAFGFSGSGGKTHVKSYVRGPRAPKAPPPASSNDLAPRGNLPQYNAVEQRALAKKMQQGGRVAPLRSAESRLTSPKADVGWTDYAKGGKVQKVMHEFKTGALHSGSKKGPVVKSRKQAIAIAMSEAGKSKKMAFGGRVFGALDRGRRMARPATLAEPLIAPKLPRVMPAPGPLKSPGALGVRPLGAIAPGPIGMKKGGKVKC